MLVEIRIALPKTRRVAVVDSRITIVVRLIDGVTASRQTITIAYVDWRAGLVIRYPVTFATRRIAPASIRIPMPGLVRQFGPQAISQRFESSRKHCRDIRRRKLACSLSFGVTIDAGAQRVRRIEAICRMAGREKNRHRCLPLILIAALSKDGERLK